MSSVDFDCAAIDSYVVNARTRVSAKVAVTTIAAIDFYVSIVNNEFINACFSLSTIIGVTATAASYSDGTAINGENAINTISAGFSSGMI